MNWLQQLIKAAKAATSGPWSDTRYQEIYVGHDPENMIIGPDDESIIAQNVSDDNSTFIALANPATILELCALLEKAEGALIGVMSAAAKVADKQHAFDVANDNFSDPRPEGESLCQALIAATEADNTANEALAAIKQWKEQT